MTGGGGGSGWSSHADAIVGDVGGVLGGREGKAGGRDGFAVLFRCGECEVEFEQESNHRLPCFQAFGLRVPTASLRLSLSKDQPPEDRVDSQ